MTILVTLPDRPNSFHLAHLLLMLTYPVGIILQPMLSIHHQSRHLESHRAHLDSTPGPLHLQLLLPRFHPRMLYGPLRQLDHIQPSSWPTPLLLPLRSIQTSQRRRRIPLGSGSMHGAKRGMTLGPILQLRATGRSRREERTTSGQSGIHGSVPTTAIRIAYPITLLVCMPYLICMPTIDPRVSLLLKRLNICRFVPDLMTSFTKVVWSASAIDREQAFSVNLIPF